LKIEMAKLEALELVAHPHNRVDIAPAREAAQILVEKAADAAKVLLEAQKKP
jgi:hypothetical protein